MKKLVEIIVLAVMILLLGVQAEASEKSVGKSTGYLGASFFPVNDEHETPATLEGYVQYGNDYVFMFTGFMFDVTNNIPERIRMDNRYITGIDFGIGYLSDVQLGIGYNLNKSFDVRLFYKVQREPNGYEGDWTGVQVRWNFGER